MEWSKSTRKLYIVSTLHILEFVRLQTLQTGRGVSTNEVVKKFNLIYGEGYNKIKRLKSQGYLKEKERLIILSKSSKDFLREKHLNGFLDKNNPIIPIFKERAKELGKKFIYHI